MAIIDANYILRYLLNDIDEQSQIATSVIEEKQVRILNEVLAEVVYVLQKVYDVDRESIRDGLKMVIEYDNVDASNKDVLREALVTYSNTELDFVDCLLYSYNQVENEGIFTFDKKLNRLIESKTD